MSDTDGLLGSERNESPFDRPAREAAKAARAEQSDSLQTFRESHTEVDVLRRIEDAATDLDVMFGGKPGAWRLDGRKLTEEAAGALLILHDCLTDAAAWRDPSREGTSS